MSSYNYNDDDDWFDDEDEKKKNAWWDTTMFKNEVDYLNWYNLVYLDDD